jgi:hypothetical protein
MEVQPLSLQEYHSNVLEIVMSVFADDCYGILCIYVTVSLSLQQNLM